MIREFEFFIILLFQMVPSSCPVDHWRFGDCDVKVRISAQLVGNDAIALQLGTLQAKIRGMPRLRSG